MQLEKLLANSQRAGDITVTSGEGSSTTLGQGGHAVISGGSASGGTGGFISHKKKVKKK